MKKLVLLLQMQRRIWNNWASLIFGKNMLSGLDKVDSVV